MAVAAPPAYPSAPSSPKGFGNPFEYYYYTSAPTSPSQRSSSPWEEEEPRAAEEFDFNFGFVGRQLKNEGPPPALAAADELFEGGRIRPLNHPTHRPSSSSSSFTAPPPPAKEVAARERGRAPTSLSSTSTCRSRRGARSLSPTPSTATTSLARSHGSKKWSLKDLFLFRSASEGRAAGGGRGKNPLLKYTLLSSSPPENLKNDGNGLSRRRRPTAAAAAAAASLHEAHYTANRAASEELKRRTPLPFHSHSLFGYLRSNPAIHSITRRFSGRSNGGRQSS